jgi:hypothetical protein
MLKPDVRAPALVMSALCPIATPAEPVDTNRPGFSFTPGIVAVGQLQIETGVTYTRFSSDFDNLALPAADIRFGIADRIEGFVSSVSRERNEVGADDTSGMADPDLGVKIGLTEQAAAVQMSLLLKVSVPVGSDALSSDRWDPTAGLVWTGSGSIPLAGTVTVSSLDTGLQLDNGLKLPFSLGDGRSAFFEWEANLPEGGDDTHWLNGGFQWLPGERWQLDVNAGLGLNDDAGDYRAGVGFSFRL